MPTIVQDSYGLGPGESAAEDLSAHTATTGSTWTRASGPSGVLAVSASGRIYPVTASSIGVYLATALSSTADYSASADVVLTSAAFGSADIVAGVVLRSDAGGQNYYGVWYHQSPSAWELFKVVGGVRTNLGTAGQSLTQNTVYTVVLTATGTSLSVTVNGSTVIGPITDSTFAGPGQGGVIGYVVTAQGPNAGLQAQNFVLSQSGALGAATSVALVAPSPASGDVGAASGSYTVSLSPRGGTTHGSCIVVPSDGAGGSFWPPSVLLDSNTAPQRTFVYLPAAAGTQSVALTNTGNVANPAVSAYTASAPGAGQVVWNPLARQVAEADTTFGPLDGAVETGLVAFTPNGGGGFLMGDLGTQQRTTPLAPVGTAPGRFRLGHRPTSGTFNVWSMPVEGLLDPAEWQIELWALADAAWATTSGDLAALGGDNATAPWSVRLNLDGANHFRVQYNCTGETQGTPGGYAPFITLDSTNWPTGGWVSIAVQFKSGVLTLFVNGQARAWDGGVSTGLPTPAPAVTSGQPQHPGGLVLCGSGSGNVTPMTSVTISDLRISRYARSLNSRFTLPTPTLTVSTGSTTGTRSSTLVAGLHEGHQPGETASTDPAGYALAPWVPVRRLDKMLTPTPIKSGGTDASHPTAGHSGLYSYDWQVVDRTIQGESAQVGANAEFYIGLSSNVQILGGTTPPFSGSQLTGATTSSSGFDGSVPNNFTSYATLCSDLLYHLMVDLGARIRYVGFWNEPDGSNFWAGTQNQFFGLYAAVVAAVQTALPGGYTTPQVGGPEVSGMTSSGQQSWVSGLISYCQTNSVPLQFISYHAYDGDLGMPSRVRRLVDSYRTSAGFSGALPLLIGETDWSAYMIQGGYGPYGSDGSFMVNDWHAAWLACQLVEAQRMGLIYHVLTNTRTQARGSFNSYGGCGYASRGTLWSNAAVANCWSRLGDQILAQSGERVPGLSVLATKDSASGRIAVLLSCLRYRTSTALPQTLTLSGLSGARRVRYTLVDSTHNDPWDTNTTQAVVTQSSPPAQSPAGTVTMTLRGRSVHLLEFIAGPPTRVHASGLPAHAALTGGIS